MAPEPVVLRRARPAACARRSARAAARPRAGPAGRSRASARQSRRGGDLPCRGHAGGRTAIRDANVRYHDLAAEHYDSKWGIGYDEVGQAQVTGKLRKALGPRAARRRLRARARDRRRHRLLHAQPAARRGDPRRGRHRHLAGHAARAVGVAPSELGAGRGDGRAARRRRCRSRTTRSTSSSATRCCTTCPTWTPPSASFGGCCARAAWWPSAASRRATATASSPVPKRGAPGGRAAVARADGRGLAQRQRRPAPAEEDQLEQVVDVHAFTPGDLGRHAAAAGFGTCA